MAITGTNSKFAIAKQSAKDVPGTGGYYVHAIAPQFMVADNVRMRRPHIGDSPFMRNAYKVGVGVPVGASFEATPNIMGTVLDLALGKTWTGQWFRLLFTGTGIGGNFTVGTAGTQTAAITYTASTGPTAKAIEDALMATDLDGANERFIVSKVSPTEYYIGWVGLAAVTAKVMTAVPAALTVSGGDAATAVPTDTTKSAHLIMLDTTDKYKTNWFTAWRDVGGEILERGMDGKVATVELGFTAADSVVCNFAGAALRPDKVNGSTIQMMGEAFDNLNIFTVMDGAHATLQIEDKNYSTRNVDAGDNKYLTVKSAGFGLNNNLTPIDTRYRIGSKYPVGLDILSRDVSIQMAVEIDNSDLYDQLMYEGTEWNEAVMEGSVSVAATTESLGIGGYGNLIEMHTRNVFFGGLLVPQIPRQLVTGILTASVLANNSTSSEVEFYLFNEDSTV